MKAYSAFVIFIVMISVFIVAYSLVSTALTGYFLGGILGAGDQKPAAEAGEAGGSQPKGGSASGWTVGAGSGDAPPAGTGDGDPPEDEEAPASVPPAPPAQAYGGGGGSGSGQGPAATGGGSPPQTPDNPDSTIYISPPESSVGPGDEFEVYVYTETAVPVYAVEFYVNYQPDVLDVIGVTEGGFLKRDGAGTYYESRQKEGYVVVGITRFDTVAGMKGIGSLAKIRFRARDVPSPAYSHLSLQNMLFLDAGMSHLSVGSEDGSVMVG